jgi:hypothetical protein
VNKLTDAAWLPSRREVEKPAMKEGGGFFRGLSNLFNLGYEYMQQVISLPWPERLPPFSGRLFGGAATRLAS